MRVSFLVLLACLCLSAVAAAKQKKEQKEQSSFVNKDGFNVDTEKSTVVTEDVETKTVKNGDVVEEEEITKIRTSVNGKRKGKRKKEGIERPEQTCEELLAKDISECQPQSDSAKCDFLIHDRANCAFECRCEEIKTEYVEEHIAVEGENGGAEKKVRKVKKAGEKKKKAVAGGRECAGEKKLSFSNCLIKMKGLVAWGENTANFDEKFARL